MTISGFIKNKIEYPFNTTLNRIICLDNYQDNKFLSEACVIHATKCSISATLASGKIAKFISCYLKIPLVDDLKSIIGCKKNKKYKYLFIVSSMFNWCNFLNELKEFIGLADNIIWIQNDYGLKIPKVWRGKVYSIWTTISKYIDNNTDTYINWNKLLYYDAPLFSGNKIKGLFYYGAFRKGRIDYFKKYFIGSDYKTFVSTGNRSIQKFYDLNNKHLNFKVIKPLKNLIFDIRYYFVTLYLEDKWSHNNYCSPANRFYECLGAGIPILFDNNCINTFDTAGYDISSYIVNNVEDINKYFIDEDRLMTIGRYQQRKWKRDYIKELTKEVDQAILKLGFI